MCPVRVSVFGLSLIIWHPGPVTTSPSPFSPVWLDAFTEKVKELNNGVHIVGFVSLIELRDNSYCPPPLTKALARTCDVLLAIATQIRAW